MSKYLTIINSDKISNFIISSFYLSFYYLSYKGGLLINLCRHDAVVHRITVVSPVTTVLDTGYITTQYNTAQYSKIHYSVVDNNG